MKKAYFVLILFILGCNSKETPPGILPKQKMVKVLIDIHLIEAKVNSLSLNHKDSGSAVYLALQDSVMRKNNVTLNSYIESYRYYRENPALLDDIYANVVDSLSLRQNLLKVD